MLGLKKNGLATKGTSLAKPQPTSKHLLQQSKHSAAGDASELSKGHLTVADNSGKWPLEIDMRIGCCCINKRSWAWRRTRCLQRRKTTVALWQCCSKTQGKEGDMIHKHGWKLRGKWDKWAGLLIDRLCLLDELSQEKFSMEETNSSSTSPSRICLNVSLSYTPTLYLP